jgi:hypothetical protein
VGRKDYDLAIWQRAVGALVTGRLLLVTCLDVADRKAIANVAESLRQSPATSKTVRESQRCLLIGPTAPSESVRPPPGCEPSRNG